MGFDVTFHPVAAEELQYFVFDVLDRPSLLPDRLRELSSSAAERQVLGAMFERVLQALALRDAGDGTGTDDGDGDERELGIDDEDDDGGGSPEELLPFLAAGVAGYLHPYWYARGAGLSFSRDPQVHELFVPYPDIARGRVHDLGPHCGSIIFENFTASGFIPPQSVLDLAQRLDAADPRLLEELGDQGTAALRRALAYARDHSLGLIEASDVVIPGGSFFATDPANLRASHLGNLDAPARPARRDGGAAASNGPLECPACGLVNTPGSDVCECGQPLAPGERLLRGFGAARRGLSPTLGAGLLIVTVLAAAVAYKLRAPSHVIVGIVVVGAGWGLRALAHALD